MNNENMIAGRFERWANYRKLARNVIAHIQSGGVVDVCSATRRVRLDARHIDYIKTDKRGIYIRSGKRWEDVQFCKLLFGRMVQKTA